ncbi:phytoene dehydrogenase (phytoene desaturase) [Parvularcula bermudensis HTCC2503]|uniref:Phytoene dehydrogenase n=1 Tax=Parvularcula bermudensis (strain ATCC BAA-594 / HTCC2503 / KCTC 12087) TaxID=314260 RepID=E0THV8_PARBH|nr:phytoene desaturase [Parvularcula bermudensis]ADM10251.1 phytoene dehydrogenase (phytoene desaturase) [Parvularcula bermudensis HTCC2503]
MTGQKEAGQKEACVIGGGFGGLALACRLQAAGLATTLIEGRDKLGGRAYVYSLEGYTFDAGPTVVTDPSALEEIFAMAGRRLSDYVELLNVDPLYRLHWEDGYSFDYAKDEEHLLSQIRAKNPKDVEGYRKFYRYSEAVFKEGYEKLGAVPFLNFWSMVKAAPQLTTLQAFRSVYGRVADFIEDEQLRQAFSFHTLLVGGDPHKTSSIYALIHALERKWGVWFPRGGTGALIEGLGRLFTDLGGTLRLEDPVTDLKVQNDRITQVTTESGWSHQFDAVASNADIVHTYDNLLGGSKRGPQAAKGLKQKRFSNSLFVTYFGTKKQYPDIAHHSILFGPRYRELIAEIFSGPQLPNDFSLYLHRPTATDPGLAPPGCDAFYVLSPVPNLEKAGIDWSVTGPEYQERILAYLEERYLPGLRDNLAVTHRFTPADFKDKLNAHVGSAFSLEPVLTQSAYFRLHNRDDKIGNLYFVGAGTHPGAGIPGVVGSAKATAGLMIEDMGLSRSNRGPKAA